MKPRALVASLKPSLRLGFKMKPLVPWVKYFVLFGTPYYSPPHIVNSYFSIFYVVK